MVPPHPLSLSHLPQAQDNQTQRSQGWVSFLILLYLGSFSFRNGLIFSHCLCVAHINFWKEKWKYSPQSNLSLFSYKTLIEALSVWAVRWLKEFASDHDFPTSLSNGPFTHIDWKIQTSFCRIPTVEPTSIQCCQEKGKRFLWREVTKLIAPGPACGFSPSSKNFTKQDFCFLLNTGPFPLKERSI